MPLHENAESNSSFVISLAAVSGLLLSVSVLLLYLRNTKKQNTTPAAPAPAEVDRRPVVRICYGTQTGTAEKFSKQLASALAQQYGETTRMDVVDMEQYDYAGKLGEEAMVFFIVATYGDGEPTDNCLTFYQWLLEASEAVMNGQMEEPCEGTPYGVFGLGNRQYEHFNAVGKAVHKHMEVIGGKPLLDVGIGDDDADIADDFETWLDALLKVLEKSDLLTKMRRSTEKRVLTGYECAVSDPGSHSNGSMTVEHMGSITGGHSISLARVGLVRELHSPASTRSCVHVEIDISGLGLTYEHGDHIAVFAENSREVVEEACSLLGFDPETVISLTTPDGNPEMLSTPLPCPTTLRNALSQHASLLSAPDKQALEALASCATAEEVRTPVIMVGPGTGVAPFRGFLQHRAALLKDGASLGSATLFFGCRHPDQDNIYHQELQDYNEDGVLSDLHVAFSRVSDAKDYVQHHMLKHGEAFYSMLSRGAFLYVCGDAKHMAKDVHRALHEIVKTWDDKSSSNAEAFVKEMQASGRYMQDVW